MHPSATQIESVVQTNLAKAQVAIYHPKDNDFQIFVRRSFAEYLWTWLEDASFEYGITKKNT
jgi:sarcosine oxidase subunit gamma